MEGREIIRVEDLWISYEKNLFGVLRKTRHIVVKGISFSVNWNESFGLIGASGSGKTTILKAFLGLVRPFKGEIYLEGEKLYYDGKINVDMLRKIGFVPQDPFSSVDPRMKIMDIIGEPLRIRGLPKKVVQQAVENVLELVKLDNQIINKYPHQLSGGMLQRVAIARALITKPKIMLLDEPTSHLDVVTQFEILALLKDLKEMFGYSYIMVSHDLNVISYISNRIGVLLNGFLIEEGPTKNIIEKPLHPYTKILVESSKFKTIAEPVYSTIGCPIHPICPWAKDICKKYMPPPTTFNESIVRCWHYLDYVQR
ncbi:MAG: ABC transporter ATP-binding protein [Ignisphaera sp.]